MEIELLNKRINYEYKGDGNAMLFVHGWGGNIESLDGLYQYFSKNFKCFKLDLPGFGKSQNPDSNWGIIEYSNLIELFIKKVIKSKVTYLGHSFGGSIGLYLAANSDVIDEMVLFAPPLKRKGEKKTSFSKKIPFYNILKPALYPFRKLVYRLIYPDSQALTYPHLEENFKKLVTQSLVSELPKIKNRTLIIWGDKDSFVSVEEGYMLDKGLKNSQLKVYNDVEHNLPIVKIDEVVNDINYFLNKSYD